jgi:hypothetical protein
MVAATIPPEKPSQAMSLLDQVLEGKSSEFQAKVLKWAYKAGVREDDMLFLVMVGIGQLELILEESPKELKLLFEQWSENLYDKLKDTERVAVKSQQVAISKAVSELLAQTEGKQSRRIFSSIVPAGALLAIAVGIGFLLGLTLPPWLEGGYSSDSKPLTVAEAEVLRWGMSKEGKFARNLLKWNAGSLDQLECLKDAQELPVTLKVQGRPASSGFCLLWVVSPQNRSFK